MRHEQGAQPRPTRRRFLHSAAGVGAGISAAGLVGLLDVASADARAEDVPALIDLATSAETLAVTFYDTVLTGASFHIDEPARQHLRQVLDAERAHLRALRSLGGHALHAQVYLPERLQSDAGVFVSTGVTIETALVALYLAATQRCAARAQARLALMAAQYGADDAQHLALLGHLAGLSPHGLAGPTPTVARLSKAVAALAPFFHGGAGFTGPVSARVAQVERTAPADTVAART
jgi:Ferritin-like domain